MEREYKTIKTPVQGDTIQLKTWLTAREKREIQNVYFQDVAFKQGGDYEIQANKVNEAQDKTIQMTVESINSTIKDKNLILEYVLDEMRSKDFEFLLSEIEKITSTDVEDKKKE